MNIIDIVYLYISFDQQHHSLCTRFVFLNRHDGLVYNMLTKYPFYITVIMQNHYNCNMQPQ